MLFVTQSTYLNDDQRLYLSTVVQSQKKGCFNANKIAVNARHGGFLASAVTEERGLGTFACPWLLQAGPGQRLNITLWDFTGPATLLQDSKHLRNSPNDVLKV